MRLRNEGVTAAAISLLLSGDLQFHYLEMNGGNEENLGTGFWHPYPGRLR